MDNPEILATVGPQDTGHTQSKTKLKYTPKKKKQQQRKETNTQNKAQHRK